MDKTMKQIAEALDSENWESLYTAGEQYIRLILSNVLAECKVNVPNDKSTGYIYCMYLCSGIQLHFGKAIGILESKDYAAHSVVIDTLSQIHYVYMCTLWARVRKRALYGTAH